MLSIKTNITKFVNTTMRDMKNDLNKATLSATTKTARQGANAAKKAVRDNYTIPASELNKATKIVGAKSNAPEARIIITGAKLAMSKYRALKNKIKGATAMIIKGKRVVIPGDVDAGNKSFVATMKSGNKGIFYRTTNKRLPITHRVGPSAPDLMRGRRPIQALKEYAKANYERLLKSEYKYFSNK